MAHRPAKKTVESRLTVVERGIKSLQANDAAIIRSMRDGFSQMGSAFANVEARFVNVESPLSSMESHFASMEKRLDQIYIHVDGFMKLSRDSRYRVPGYQRTDAAS